MLLLVIVVVECELALGWRECQILVRVECKKRKGECEAVAVM